MASYLETDDSDSGSTVAGTGATVVPDGVPDCCVPVFGRKSGPFWPQPVSRLNAATLKRAANEGIMRRKPKADFTIESRFG